MEIIAKFKADSFYPQIRKKYFTMIDWFSFVGGILGLFFGFSFLSAFEVVFHVSRGLFGGKRNKVEKHQRSFWIYLNNLLKDSSVHGFKYIFGDEFKMIER